MTTICDSWFIFCARLVVACQYWYTEKGWLKKTREIWIMCKCSSICSSWREWIRPILILAYILFVLIVVPYVIAETVRDGFTQQDQLILIGGLFVIVSVPLCIWHIVQHILHFNRPIEQKPIIRILWMVPIYSVNAVREI